jgi:hypothetical protein
MVPSALHCLRQQRLGHLVTILVLLAVFANASAQCESRDRRGRDSPAGNHHVQSPPQSALELAISGTGQFACHREIGGQSLEGIREPSARHSLAEDRPGMGGETEFNSQMRMAPPLHLNWDLSWEKSPDWVQEAPNWVRSARYFRRRGLPLVHLWESPQFLLALGLSGHGVPGVYFTQKLPN